MGAEVAAQDQDALGVQRAAERHLALDIDDLALADADPRGDPARLAEGEAADLEHGEPVDLADHRAAGVDRDGAAADLLLGALAHPVQAPDLGVHGVLHLGGADRRAARLPGPVIGLAQQVGERFEARRQAFGIAGLARRVLERPGDAGAIERLELLGPRQRRDESGEQRVVLV